jgi:nicotinate phosphoribosyltransferase
LDNRNTTTDHRPDGKDAAAKREQALERLIDMVEQSGDVGFVTDKYFTNTRQIVEAVADTEATYAVFMRRRVIAALAPV